MKPIFVTVAAASEDVPAALVPPLEPPQPANTKVAHTVTAAKTRLCPFMVLLLLRFRAG
jgi:hypothetical protein